MKDRWGNHISCLSHPQKREIVLLWSNMQIAATIYQFVLSVQAFWVFVCYLVIKRSLRTKKDSEEFKEIVP